MIAHLDDLPFAVLPKPLAGSWQRPRLGALAERVLMVPAADTEILQLSHSLPLVIEDHSDGFRVMALLHAGFLARPVIGPEGQWLPAYAPMALRAMPFRRRRNGKGQLVTEMLRDAAMPAQGEAMPLAAAEGGPSAEVKALLRLADRLAAGRLRLQHAAEKLAAAGLLDAIHLAADQLPRTGANGLYVLDPDAFGRVEGLRLTALCEDGLIAIELATAMEFSRRMLAANLRREPRPRGAALAELRSAAELPLGGFVALDVQLDGSELISVEHFQSAA